MFKSYSHSALQIRYFPSHAAIFTFKVWGKISPILIFSSNERPLIGITNSWPRSSKVLFSFWRGTFTMFATSWYHHPPNSLHAAKICLWLILWLQSAEAASAVTGWEPILIHTNCKISPCRKARTGAKALRWKRTVRWEAVINLTKGKTQAFVGEIDTFFIPVKWLKAWIYSNTFAAQLLCC